MKENILVINAGSTAVKYKLFNENGKVILAEKFSNKVSTDKIKEEKFLKQIKKISGKDNLFLAFRVVHGGDLHGPIILNKEIIKKIKKFKIFAPIHNKIVLKKISKIQKIFPTEFENHKFWAIFDTDFHQNIPVELSTYPIDQKIAKKYKIKKYGFHGIAVQSVLKQAQIGFQKRNKKIPAKIIVAHLGGGSSLTAVKNGKSIANTMGLTPISGLMMTTRVGDVDSDLDKILAQLMGKTLSWVSDWLSRQAGFLGLTGSADTKEIFAKAQAEAEQKLNLYNQEKLAFDIYLNQIVEKISGYVGLLGGIDLIIFSGGIGEGNSYLRKKILERLKFLGINKNKILVFEAGEEEEIFRQIIEVKNIML